MSRGLYFLSILFLLIFQSCSTVDIVSNKQPEYNKQPKKIFIIVSCNKDADFLCKGLIHGLTKKLAQKGVQADGYMLNSLSLDSEENRNKRIKSYNPEAILTIQQGLTINGRRVFELTLIDYESGKNVWKSEFEVSISYYNSPEGPGVIDTPVKAPIDKLTADKII
jgi:hypothetical protein